MSKKIKTIKCNERMEVTNFFGFQVAPDAIQQKNYLDAFSAEPSLYIDGDKVAEISWFDHFFGQKPTENEIWDYILKECRKHTRAPKIFIDKYYVEEIYKPLATSFH